MYYAIQQLIEENGKQREEKAKREGIIEGKREGIIEGKREGIIEGKREGIIEGEREGIIKGKREGIIEGIIEERQNSINHLIGLGKDFGVSTEDIARQLENRYSLPHDEAIKLASQ